MERKGLVFGRGGKKIAQRRIENRVRCGDYKWSNLHNLQQCRHRHCSKGPTHTKSVRQCTPTDTHAPFRMERRDSKRKGKRRMSASPTPHPPSECGPISSGKDLSVRSAPANIRFVLLSAECASRLCLMSGGWRGLAHRPEQILSVTNAVGGRAGGKTRDGGRVGVAQRGASPSLNAPPSPRRKPVLLHVRTRGDQHKKRRKKMARQWPKRPYAPFCHKESTPPPPKARPKLPLGTHRRAQNRRHPIR